MAWLIGAALAALMCAGARLSGFDRERVFYPVMLVVIASYYVLFVVMAGNSLALVLESGIAFAFLAAALAGFKRTLWIVAAALAAHGVYDFIHDALLRNAGVPGWWPSFCLAFDLVAAAGLGVLLLGRAGSFDAPPSGNK